MERDRQRVRRFPAPRVRPSGWRSAFGAAITLVALLGSLVAAALGPAIGEALPYPLLVLLMLVRG